MRILPARRLLALTVLAGLFLGQPALAQKDEAAEVLLQAARQKQLVDGQLEEAIQLYRRVVQEHAGNRALAAQALLEMGQCYEKLGNTEARRAYERLLRDYGDQDEAAAAARKRLAALGQPAGPGSGAGMVTRRLWTGPGQYITGSVSPDGRYLSCVDLTTGNLAVRELATGKLRLLTHTGSGVDTGEYAFFSTMSPDGKEVAYNWFGGKEGPNLRLVRWDGSAPRVLYVSTGLYPFPTDWSPDGKYVLVFLYRESSNPQIALISVADGSVRIIKTLDDLSLTIRFSPDGRYVAYDVAEPQDSGNHDIFLLTADGSREIHLVENPADDQLLGWTPDGNILFASDRSGTMSAWLLHVEDGKPQGLPELVKPDIGQAQPIGFTRTGAFYYGLVIGASDVYTADFDPVTGKAISQPQRAVQRFVGSNFSPAWSPDGESLAYISSRHPGLVGHRPELISIRSLKTGEERDLAPKLSYLWGPIRWSPDGRSLLVPGKDEKIQHGLFLVDVHTAAVTPAMMWGGRAVEAPDWFPDGKRLIFASQHFEPGTATVSIVIRDLATGQEKVFFQPTAGVEPQDMALSPDGQQVALTLLEKETRSSVLKVLPVGGGEASELARAKEPETIVGDSLSWSPDSHYVIFGKAVTTNQETQGGYFPTGRKTQLFAVSSRGGEQHALGLATDSAHRLSFDPSGHHLAFAAGRAKTEIWVMENFLPELRLAK